MGHIVAIDERGAIQLPEDLVAAVKPPSRYVVELNGATLILHPAEEQPLWTTAPAAERADAVRRWNKQPSRVLLSLCHRQQTAQQNAEYHSECR